jgi:hypothetical protein
MVTLAKEYDGMSWNEVAGMIKRFNAATNTYALKDGSVAQKKYDSELGFVVKHVNDGLRKES